MSDESTAPMQHSTEQEPPPRMISVPSEELMYELLNALNVSGQTCELPCVMVVDVGRPGHPNIAVSPFLATLTEPGADYVNYIYSDEGGRSRCVVGCDECGSLFAPTWEPTYPVTALLAVEPDIRRCREDNLNAWWACDHSYPPANRDGTCPSCRKTRLRTEVSVCEREYGGRHYFSIDGTCQRCGEPSTRAAGGDDRG